MRTITCIVLFVNLLVFVYGLTDEQKADCISKCKQKSKMAENIEKYYGNTLAHCLFDDSCIEAAQTFQQKLDSCLNVCKTTFDNGEVNVADDDDVKADNEEITQCKEVCKSRASETPTQ